jgi:hypothetical protein
MNGNQSAPLSPTDASLQTQVQGLQKLLTASLALVLVIGVSLAGYLYGQNRIVKTQLREAETFVKDYNEKSVPEVNRLKAGLLYYGAGHPDFAPILQKFGMDKKPGAPAAADGAAPSSAPASTGTTPKR